MATSLGALLASSAARAATMAIQLAAGGSSFSLKAGSTFDRSGGFGLEFRPQVGFEFSSFNAALFFSYQGRIGSNFGAFPLSRFGGGLQYYPFGLPLRRVVLDSGVTVHENRFVPFLLGQASLVSVAVTDFSQAQPFNGLTIGYQIGAGVEFPIGATLSILSEALMEGTLAGGVSADGKSGISLSSYAGLVGISIRP